MLGRVLDHSGSHTQAVPVLREAVSLWEKLVARAGGHPWEQLLTTSAHARAARGLHNLSAAMGDLANALRDVGQHDEALAVSESAIRIDTAFADLRSVAVSHGQIAKILMDAGRYDEADTRYELALAAARQVGDQGLVGLIFQHQGTLALNRKQLDRANRLYQLALQRFQEAGDAGQVMRTYNALGVVEWQAGRLSEARAWHVKSRELAMQLKNQVGLGAAAQNIGIICQLEGEAARARGDEAAARLHFDEARRSVEESLRIEQSLRDKPGEADSLTHLAQIHLPSRRSPRRRAPRPRRPRNS
jgi:tetratricopeptide (TPR) repeat protein